MTTKDSKVIMFNSQEAATYRTNLSGWVSSNGRYFGVDERAARYDGCTHVSCDVCGSPVERGWLVCPKCRAIRDERRYNAMPKVKWDEKGMLYSMTADRYFSKWDDVEYYCEDEDITEERLRLVICEPQFLHLLDKGDYGCDEIAEDGELPDRVLKAIDDFNKVISKVGAVSWMPGNKAAIR